MLGLAQDNVNTLLNAAQYITEWSVTHARYKAERQARHAKAWSGEFVRTRPIGTLSALSGKGLYATSISPA
jgi:hypothetical protein